MPVYKHDINDLLSEEDAENVLRECESLREQALVSILWGAGARPSEVLELKTSDIIIYEDEKTGEEVVQFSFVTKKLGSRKLKSGDFFVEKRTLKFIRPKPPTYYPNIFLEIILKFKDMLESSPVEDETLFPFSKRTMERYISKWGLAALGKPISPYHFRHSACSREAASGKGLNELMHFKGSRTVDSVRPYVHVMPYNVAMGMKKKVNPSA
jgi:site-specific recombinase XerD